MSDLVQVETKGLDETQANLQRAAAQLRGPGLEPAMKAATLAITRDAKIYAPFDRGHLRASIKPEIRQRDTVLEGVVGSNLEVYPAAQELGTAPFWPPIAALEVWAERHHTSAFIVARAIARRGIRAIHYLQRAFDKNKSAIEALLKRAVEGIVREANE